MKSRKLKQGGYCYDWSGFWRMLFGSVHERGTFPESESAIPSNKCPKQFRSHIGTIHELFKTRPPQGWKHLICRVIRTQRVIVFNWGFRLRPRLLIAQSLMPIIACSRQGTARNYQRGSRDFGSQIQQ